MILEKVFNKNFIIYYNGMKIQLYYFRVCLIKMQFKNEDRKGYMKKLKNSSFNRLFGNTNLRWFELNFIDKTFGYKDDHNSPILRYVIKFLEIKEVISPGL